MPALCRPVLLLALVAGSLSPSPGIIGHLRAQEQPPPSPAEAEVRELGGRELAGYAARCFADGYPGEARRCWLEVLGEYDPDHDGARQALGFRRHGDAWQRDPDFAYPAADRPDPRTARALQQRWRALTQRLAGAHQKLAQRLADAGEADRSRYHAERALRFAPDDAAALALSGRELLDGVSGDAIDRRILRRSRAMNQRLAELRASEPVADLVDEALPMLAGLGIAHRAAASAHFTVFGDWEPAVLQAAAQQAERCLAFCEHVFADCDGFPGRARGERLSQLVFLRDRAAWERLVRARIDGREAERIVAAAQATSIDGVETAAVASPRLVQDLATRWVAQDQAGFGADALEEGIGHAVVGMFFGRNLVFSVGDAEVEGTVSGREARQLLLPDLATWTDLAIEFAWLRTSTPVAQLPLLDHGEFPGDARILAWSLCDYLLRRDPALLRRLDDVAARARTVPEVLAGFARDGGPALGELEVRWRRFWREDTALAREVLGRGEPLAAVGKQAGRWLDAFNRLRERHGVPAVGWSLQLSVACRQHGEYLVGNKDQRGAAAEHRQLAGRDGATTGGHAFAANALVVAGERDPNRALAAWLTLPGCRDAVLDRNIDTIGVFTDGDVAVLDASRGLAPTAGWHLAIWPLPSGPGAPAAAGEPVPAAVDVALLGPDVEALLAAHGRDGQRTIGLPLSLHLYGGAAADVQCEVTAGGTALDGVLVRGDGGCRRTAAPGMWVFYPFAPLPRGVPITVRWTLPGDAPSTTFTAR